ncbi:MAG TPA: hypothetical protein VFQ60_02275 [Patescibacteria group bacterium]|nr:hypothetical protein [Patescibacteria group bacterium]
MVLFPLPPVDQPPPPKEAPPKHYYGDHVRKLFLLAGALMICTFPFFQNLIDVPVSLTIFFVLIIALFAGIQSPRHRWTALFNSIVSITALCVFEYKAVSFYFTNGYDSKPTFFWTNELLALIFFFALYFGTKSLRAMPARGSEKITNSDTR